ncbi:hypothetical protein LTR36_002830 [Oleoguttula mirabilis]|uniref:Thioredoxin domain-containing protein n=1 Tax=Oleoguttula mirabilis TaxID=1507867 RepID=A0AAV9JJT4_9PEZI|nr:hypothetical protein LTR36_002830 [Oleoguttula mirabilis]
MATRGKVEVGKPAPNFNRVAVVDGSLKDVSLSSYTEANHWLILVFFPKAWSFICPTEIKAFSARLEEFLYSRSCAVVFASTDSEYCLRAWNGTSDMEGGLGGVHIPLISDCDHQMSKDYGVLIEEEGVAQRALFIIDPKGIVRCTTINDANVGRSVDEAQRVLDALVFKDEFGEGCPVDWKKGDKGINTTTPMEGNLELKKSWSEWARPRLQRAWSGASQRSLNSVMSANIAAGHRTGLDPPMSPLGSGAGHRLDAGGVVTPYHSAYHSAAASGQNSPMVSPTSAARDLEGQMDDAMLAQKMENIEAAMQNQGIISVAN